MKPTQQFLLLTLTPFVASILHPAFVTAQQNTTFDWGSLQGSDNISWVSCYGTLQCARLNTPLNYSDPSAGTGTVAMTHIPASVPRDSPAYKGPIFVNPGGPGGSGVDLMLGPRAPLIGSIFPNFDVVSFDPRGVGRSTPAVSFFTSDAEHLSWDFSNPTLDMSASPDAIARLIARSQTLNALAKERDNGILAYLTTDNVARDMKRMNEALGRDRLMFYGVSYGSALGATYAALFPDKVERIVLDGVTDTTAYYTNNWAAQSTDANKVLQAFYDSCSSSGPSLCPFYSPTPDLISTRLTTLLSSLKSRPVPAYDPNDARSQVYGIVDYAVANSAIFEALYNPYTQFSPLASALAALERGEGLPLYELGKVITSTTAPASDSAARCDTSNAVRYANEDQAAIAIQCADGGEVGVDVEEMEGYFERWRDVAVTVPFWVGIRGRCAGWKVHPDRFTGPISGNTSFPMLIIGNTKDPVTPLANAKDAASRFPGSVVLTYDAAGHTSFTAISTCVVSYMVQYFNNGTLPAEGTVCPLDPGVTFFPPASAVNETSTGTVSDLKRAPSMEIVL